MFPMKDKYRVLMHWSCGRLSTIQQAFWKTALMAAIICCSSQTGGAAVLSVTNSFTITASHFLGAPIGLGANAAYSDTGSAAIPMFDPDMGVLREVSVNISTVSPTFTGQITTAANLIGVSVGFTQTQQLQCSVSNVLASNSGPVIGPVNQLASLPIGTTAVVVATNPATINSFFDFTNSPQLAAFTGTGGPNPVGTFSIDVNLQSTNVLGVVSLLSTIKENGTYPIQIVTTYTYTPYGPPSMSIGSSGGKFVLNWPSHALGYELEASPSLINPQWSIITNGLIYSNGTYTYAPSLSALQMYFRLVAP